LGPSDFTGIRARKLGTEVATGKKEADRFPIQSTRDHEEVDFEEEDGMAKEGDWF
jgi:hypothetical protein